jgi:hypothetical protein
MTDLVERLKAALADRYRLERELGAGGMATVYLAEDLKHHRPVAIKVLRRELAASLGRERFLAEIRTTANLQPAQAMRLGGGGRAPLLRHAVRGGGVAPGQADPGETAGRRGCGPDLGASFRSG